MPFEKIVLSHNAQETMTKGISDVVCYGFFGFSIGCVLESIMSRDEKTESCVFISLEVFVQLVFIIFAFMLIGIMGGGRYGLLVYMIIMISTQSTLIKKIKFLQNSFCPGKLGQSGKSGKLEQDLETIKENKGYSKYEPTSLNDLPVH